MYVVIYRNEEAHEKAYTNNQMNTQTIKQTNSEFSVQRRPFGRKKHALAIVAFRTDKMDQSKSAFICFK